MENEFDKASCTCNHQYADQKAKLGEKISKMLKSFGAVAEDGKNTHSNYEYITSNKMVALMREHLESHRLSIIPEIVDYSESKDGKWIRSIVKMKFEIIDIDTGYSIVKMWVGADQDVGGKSCGQAITEACKRFYFKLFQVSSKEEKDPDGKTTDTPPGKSDSNHLPEIPHDSWMDFYNSWDGIVYEGNTVYKDKIKHALNDRQIGYIKKFPKEQNASNK